MIKITFSSLDYTQFDRREVRRAMAKAARQVTKSLKAAVSRRGASGRGRGRSYVGSLPGQPPARFSGDLFRSIKGRASRRGFAFIVQAIAPHAHLLEMGTKIAEPRPYFDPTFKAESDEIQAILREAIGRGLTVTHGQPGKAPNRVEI